MKKVVIADDEPVMRMDLKEIFEEAGYIVAGEASDGFDAVALCKKHRPEIVIMDIKMPLLDGIKASKMITGLDMGCCIILVTAFSDASFVEQAKNAGVMGYIVKPFDPEKIIPSIEVLAAKNHEIQNLRKNLSKIRNEMDDRKIIERAKGVIMSEMSLTEQQAYDFLRKTSMDKRCSLAEIARAILVS